MDRLIEVSKDGESRKFLSKANMVMELIDRLTKNPLKAISNFLMFVAFSYVFSMVSDWIIRPLFHKVPVVSDLLELANLTPR